METTKNTVLNNFEAAFLELSSKLNGASNSPAHNTRKKALEQVVKDGLPTRKNEEYKYTPLSNALEKAFSGYVFQTKAPQISSKEIPDVPGNKLVFINGFFSEEDSNIDVIKGLEIKVISSQKELMDNDKDSIYQDHYANLNLALASSGLHIRVDKGTVIEEPVHIVHCINAENDKAMATLRHDIEIGENAQATVCEYFIGTGDNANFTNIAFESIVAQNAIFNHYKFGLDSDAALRIDNTTCHQEQHSVYNTINVNYGGKIIRNNLNILLDGEYCESNLDGLYIPIQGGTIDNHTVVDHKMPNSNSNELYKGIMTDNSKGVFNGKVFVRPDAQKTNAFQSNKNILMSDTATINTKPQLEIWADDVKCSHGCTTGQLDKEQLFYLRARGIDEVNARKLLLKAFAEEVIEKIGVKEMKDLAENLLDSKLV